MFIFMQVLGHKEGIGLMEQADPLFLFLGLPAIPFGLFVAKLLRWEEAVLRAWRKHSNKLPLFGSLYQGRLGICYAATRSLMPTVMFITEFGLKKKGIN